MSAELANEIWSELKRYINTVDRYEAAETIVGILVDNDIDADDIKSAFKSDSDIKKAVTHYLKDHEEVEEEDEDDDYDEEEEEDY
jgi:hypothetical protein